MYQDNSVEKISSDLLYYNVNITGSKDPEKIVPAQFRENRTVAILDDPKNWVCGLTRFYVPALYIPIFKWATQVPETLFDPALRIYFEYNGVSVIKQVAYIEQSNDPFPTTGRLVWNFADFLDMINIAIKEAFDEIKTEVGFPATVSPELVFDGNTELISLFSESSMGTGSGVRFGMSNLLYSYFPSFPVKEDAITYPNIYVYFFEIKNNQINNVIFNGVPAFRVLQEFKTISLWNGVNKLLFESSTIPCEQEYDQATVNIQQRILFDFILPNDQVVDRTAVRYVNVGGQRWQQLVSNYPMKKMDMNVSVLFKDGSTAPLRINSLDSVTAKLEFRRNKPDGSINY